jgi:large subunit ribosomal protein L25
MDQVELVVQPRSVTGKKVKTLRRQGLVPLVVYGRKVTPVNVQAVEFNTKRAVARAGGQLMALRIEGEDEPRAVLARDIQRDSISGRLLHVDLYQVDVREKIQVDVSLSLVGAPPLVGTGEAMLLNVLSAVEIECLPTDIMQSIEVDVSGLVDMSDAIYVRDLAVPQGVEILTSSEEMIVRLQPILEEEEEEEEEELGIELPEVGDVEVIQRGREEEEEE